jgi:hypothetical protein
MLTFHHLELPLSHRVEARHGFQSWKDVVSISAIRVSLSIQSALYRARRKEDSASSSHPIRYRYGRKLNRSYFDVLAVRPCGDDSARLALLVKFVDCGSSEGQAISNLVSFAFCLDPLSFLRT